MKTIPNPTNAAREAGESPEGRTQGLPSWKGSYYPSQPLSVPGNREEFHIPSTRAGDVVCRFHLVWGRVEGRLQPCILTEGVSYPGFQPAGAREVYGDETP